MYLNVHSRLNIKATQMICLIVQTGWEGCFKEWMGPFHIIANFTDNIDSGTPWSPICILESKGNP